MYSVYFISPPSFLPVEGQESDFPPLAEGIGGGGGKMALSYKLYIDPYCFKFLLEFEWTLGP
jgi:hypothetical protein